MLDFLFGNDNIFYMENLEYNTVCSHILGEYIVAYAAENNNGYKLGKTKLQKLMYIVFGYFLAKKNKKIITECAIAWPYGPVFLHAYNAVDVDIDYKERLDENDFSKEERDIINRIIDVYGIYSAGKLVSWSHDKNGPWNKVKSENEYNWVGLQVPDSDIRDYFQTLNFDNL